MFIMSGAFTVPPSAAVVVSQYSRETGHDPKELVNLGVEALAGQILRDGTLTLPHYLVHSCQTCPIAQAQSSQQPDNIICFQKAQAG